MNGESYEESTAGEEGFSTSDEYGDLVGDLEDILNGEDEASGEPAEETGDSASGEEEPEEAEAPSEEEEDEEEEDEEDEEDEEEEEEDEEEEAEEIEEQDEKPAKSSKAENRFRKLSAKLEDAERRAAEAKAEAEELRQTALRTSTEHPDPEAELEKLKDEYSRVLTPAQVLASNQTNPLTGQPYTAAEAEAAIANLKQDLQFQINEVQSAVVENMGRAREAEKLSEQIRMPLASFIEKYPQLDPDSKEADKDLCDLLQTRIDSIMEMDGNLLVGFKQDPQEMIDGFERVLIKTSTMVANDRKRTDKNIDSVPARGALDDRRNSKDKTETDALLDEFDKAMAEYGLG